MRVVERLSRYTTQNLSIRMALPWVSITVLRACLKFAKPYIGGRYYTQQRKNKHFWKKYDRYRKQVLERFQVSSVYTSRIYYQIFVFTIALAW